MRSGWPNGRRRGLARLLMLEINMKYRSRQRMTDVENAVGIGIWHAPGVIYLPVFTLIQSGPKVIAPDLSLSLTFIGTCLML